MSLIFYGMLVYLYVLALRTWRATTAAVFGASLLVLLIGFSRIYPGVHYFSDVVGGFASGGIWLSALITGLETLRRRSKTGTVENKKNNPGPPVSGN
jgi:membrane-associated phospholipid phosphatase